MTLILYLYIFQDFEEIEYRLGNLHQATFTRTRQPDYFLALHDTPPTSPADDQYQKLGNFIDSVAIGKHLL